LTLALSQPARHPAGMDDDRTRGWLMARVELAIAVIAVLILPVWWIGQPGAMGAPTFDSRAYPMAFDFFPIVAEAVMLLALAWMMRIWRGPTREAPPVWRYRDGE
jgi:hypothetical protein